MKDQVHVEMSGERACIARERNKGWRSFRKGPDCQYFRLCQLHTLAAAESCYCSVEAAADDTETRARLCSDKPYLWTLGFEFHTDFMCHEMSLLLFLLTI